MMKYNPISILSLIISIILVNACSTSDRVASNAPIQKRKYNKGYFTNISFKSKGYKDEKNDESYCLPDVNKRNEKAGAKQKSDDNSIAGNELYASVDDEVIIPNKKSVALQTNSVKKINAPTHRDNIKEPEKEQELWPNRPQGTSDDGDKINGMALTGFICGVLSVIIVLIPVVLGVLGIVFSLIGMKQIKQGKGKGNGFALAGLICGIVGIVLSLAYLLWVILILGYL